MKHLQKSWSLARRLIVLLAATLGFLWIGGAVATLVILNREISAVLDSGLKETAQRLLPLAIHDLHERTDHDGDIDNLSETLGDEFEESGELITYQVRLRDGQIILRSHDAPAEPFTSTFEPGFLNKDGLRIFTQGSGDRSVFVQVAEKSENRMRAIREVLIWLLVPFFLLIAAAGAAVWWISRQAAKPILALQQDIGSRGGSNLAPVTTEGLPSELTPITDAVNRLLGHLSSALEAERAFASNSAHELRTPVAAALAQAQLLHSELGNKPQAGRASKLVHVLSRLSRLVEKLLQLARAEAGVGMVSGECDLVAISELIVSEYRDRSGQTPTRVRLSVDYPVPRAQIDADAFGIILQNLVSNALAHGIAGSSVDVSLGPGPVMTVINSGPVISPDILKTLTDRFARGKTRAEGEGLGLAIVATIIRQCGGTLSLHSPARGRNDGFEAVLQFQPVVI